MACRKTISVDTNVFLRLILRDNENMYERAKYLINTPRCYFTVIDQVVLECIFVLTGEKTGMSRELAVEAVMAVLDEPRIEYNEPLFEKVFAMFLAHPKLSLNDCYLVVKAESDEVAPLYTFDKKLAGQAEGAQLVPAA